MRLPRISLAFAMIGIFLVALDLAALRYLYHPDSFGYTPFLVMSVLPMINAIAIVGPRCFVRVGSRRRAFWIGFVSIGLATILGHSCCHWMFPDRMIALYSLPFDPFFKFSQDRLPWSLGARPDGTAYWRYYALLSLFYCWPQFLLAGLGGWIAGRVERADRAGGTRLDRGNVGGREPAS
jgi:hypothetical protein